MIQERMKGYIVDTNYEIREEKTTLYFFGRLENGESFVATKILQPYFFIEEKDAKKHSKILSKYNQEKTNNLTFEGAPVVKITGENHVTLSKVVEALHHLKINTYEADIKPPIRYMIDNDLFGSVNLEGDYEIGQRVNRIYSEPSIKPASTAPKLKVISLDTESNKETGQLFCIGLYGDKYEKTFMITEKKMKNVVPCKDEEECLTKFKEELMIQDPDIIIGWNVIEFDLFYLKEKCKKYKIPFDIGRTNDQAQLRIESGFFKTSTADIPGRQVLDAFYLVRDPFIKEAPSIKNAKFESFSLESVSQEILGTGKLIKGKNRHTEIEKIYSTDQQKLVDYNILDCKLAFDIVKKTEMLELAIERSQITGLPLDKLGASIAAFDSLYIREARKRNLVSPTTRYTQKETGITGGYVMSSKPGIYHNVVVMDFKSLYPSIIRTFNIDPASHLEKKEKNSVESPNHIFFRNTEGILPKVIEKMHDAREKAKKDKRELASYAIKIMMNSFFGVLANPNCRYFNYGIANSITHFGQMIIKLTAEQIEKKGHRVIYSDTDSVFVETKMGEKKANELSKELVDYINNFYQNYVKEEYERVSLLEIEFKKQYISMMIPAVRNKDNEEKAAKKRYAGLVNQGETAEVEIVGLEAIRGDWTEAAGDFQKELLFKVFNNQEVYDFIKKYVKKLREGKMDEKLVYRKSIRKDLDEYTKTTPPHVKAARKLDNLESNTIAYYITTDGPEPIQKLHHPLDYDHYIKKQIEPIANQVLTLLGTSFEDTIKSSKQSKLF